MKEITLTLTEQETNAILQALSQLPYVNVANLIQKIVGQAQQIEEE